MSPSGLLAGVLRSIAVNAALVRAFRRSPVEFLDVLAASGARAAPLRIGSESVLLLDEPDEIWALLTAHARRTTKGRGLVRARLLLGDGLLTSEGDLHRRHRRALQPAFQAQQIAAYETPFAAAAQRATARWTEGGAVDLVTEMSAMTLDGAGTALFGADLRAAAPQISRALTDLLGGFRLAMAPGGRRLLRSRLPIARRVHAAKDDLDRIVEDLLRETRADGATPGPVLDLLMSSEGFTDAQIRSEVMTLLLAGHETTAMALTWTLAAIDQAPDVRAELEDEWDAAARSPAGSDEDLPRTRAALAESLRLWPPSWMFSRRLREPLTLGGRTVPAGTMCLVSPYLLHRDPRWWPEPDRFRPDRWLTAVPDRGVRFDPRAPGVPRGAYLPFGAGPRMCIGEQFAWTEAATMLAELGRTWRVRVAGAPRPGPSSMTLRPAGAVRATTSRRTVPS